MTPHDSTRCAVCAYEGGDHAYWCEAHLRPSPTEGVGAVDFAAAEQMAEAHTKWAGTYTRIEVSEIVNLCRAYLALRAPVPSGDAHGRTMESLERTTHTYRKAWEDAKAKLAELRVMFAVTDAMVDRAVAAYFDRPDWVRPGNQETVPEQMRRVLTAALAAAKQGGG